MTAKKILLVSLILACLAAGGLAARQMASIWLTNRLHVAGLEFQANPEIAFLPFAINVGQLRWQGRINKFRLRFSASSAQAAPRLSSLLKGQLELEELKIIAPILLIEAAQPDATANPESGWKLPIIERLVCQNGRVDWRERAININLANLRLTAANIRPRDDFELQSDFTLTCSGPGFQSITSNSALRAKARYYSPNLSFRDLHATATLTEPAPLGNFSPLTMEFSGSLDFEEGRCRIQTARLALPGIALNCDGEYRDGTFQGALTLASTMPLPFTGSLKMTSPLVANSGRLRLPALDVSLDHCKGSGAVEFEFGAESRPKLNASLKMGALQIPTPTGPRKNFRPISAFPQLPPLPDFQLDIAFTEIRRGDLRITSPGLELAGNSDRVQLRHFSCRPGQGIVQARGLADFKNNIWRFEAQGENLPLGDFLTQAGLDGFTDGPANLDLQFAIPTENGRFSLPGLTGAAHLDFKNLRLAFLQELAALLPVLSPKNRLADVVSNGKLGVNAANGQLTVSPCQFIGKDMRGNGEGRVNLTDKTVQGNFNLFLGRLEIPLSFSGPLENPEISVNSTLLKELP